MSSQRSSDAPQNLAEFFRWREEKNAHACEDYYLVQVDRKWRVIGKLAAQPASLRNVQRNI